MEKTLFTPQYRCDTIVTNNVRGVICLLRKQAKQKNVLNVGKSFMCGDREWKHKHGVAVNVMTSTERPSRNVLLVAKTMLPREKDHGHIVVKAVDLKVEQNPIIGKVEGLLREDMFSFLNLIILRFKAEMIKECWNKELSWKNTLEGICTRGKRLFTKTIIGQTTALKTLKLEADKRHLTIEGITGCIRLIILSCKGNNIKSLS